MYDSASLLMDVTLPLACRKCGVLLNLEIREFNHGSTLHLETIVCPVCKVADTINVPGRVASVDRRHGKAMPDAS